MNIRFRQIFLLIVVFLYLKTGVNAMRIPEQVKEIVIFIYIKGSDGKLIPNGTAFFVGVKDQKKEDRFWVYLITAKHVLCEKEDGPFLPFIYLRLDKLEGGTEIVELPVVLSGETQTVFFHSDPTVDLVAIPVLPDQNKYLFKFLPEEMISTQEQFKSLKISEGSEVFFTGLFLPHIGELRNLPIVRFGRVALVTPERVNWNGKKIELYLIESSSYGGNSGSPVFFYLGSDREPGSLVVGPPVLVLAGVIKGSFQDIKPIQVTNTSPIAVSVSNLGISAVVPAFKLSELLQSSDLKKRRGSEGE
ncbi:MAG: trypsin-like peptidase domain-containing protein [Candidatus Aminicenantes bacterium]|nr:trypsin-like peptidase domain-containing protein [Candidatus Aminicenantes bacterium]